MFEIIYTLFLFVLIIEVILFVFLNMPTPKGWKGKIAHFLHNNKTVQLMKKIHLAFCLIAVLFLLDSLGQ